MSGRGYIRRRGDGIVIASTRAAHVEPLERLQEICFPTLEPSQRFRVPHYRRHIELFPEGQFVALDGEHVVGMTSSIRMAFDLDHPRHTFDQVIQGGWLTAHDPEGDWLYGADIGVHPDYRRRGIARSLYAARHRTVRRLGLKGQVTVGMMSGYGAVKDRMAAEDYFEALVAGELQDPTLTPQMKVGFRPCALVPGYLDDPVCDDYGVLIVLEAERDPEAERK